MSDINDVEAAAQKLDEFLKDQTVVLAFETLEKRYYQEFKQSKTDAERAFAHACARALDDMRNGLRAVLQAGERARIERERKEQQEEVKRQRAAASRPRGRGMSS